MKLLPASCLVVFVCLGVSGAARANSCVLAAGTTATTDFGPVNPLLATDTFSDGGQVVVTCTFTALGLLARVCFNAGLGNTSTSTNPRTLGAGTNRMNYNLYTDASHTQIWGTSTNAAPTSVLITGPILGLGSPVTTTFKFYAKLPGNQPLVKTVGNANTQYTETYSTTNTVDVAFGLLGALSACPLSTYTQRIPIPLTVTALVQKNCTINATDLAFPPKGLLTSTAAASSQITVKCTNNNAYSVSLNGGSVANNVLARKMKHETAADTVNYQLYQDSAYATIWGDATGGLPLVGLGSGANQVFTVYGRVPVQSTPRPGNYKDVITATITF
ncbi:spore coat U domain-containing protein [Achromobacter seleniivolatilans]|uniref:Spore coat U domain-containing protein n=1 Tax=Achromobacter seleniivolatilans TaxID=3047478 RepID=A0ABY9LVU9_9BURK|nr:spore coat U domain-containing protein [Achromobacter sp. R39]WMD18906.1 spore coat U domain-containing protein [Achromobacter sp. R39]